MNPTSQIVCRKCKYYYITWDAGWLKYMDNGQLKSIRPCLESAFAYKFKTVIN